MKWLLRVAICLFLQCLTSLACFFALGISVGVAWLTIEEVLGAPSWGGNASSWSYAEDVAGMLTLYLSVRLGFYYGHPNHPFPPHVWRGFFCVVAVILFAAVLALLGSIFLVPDQQFVRPDLWNTADWIRIGAGHIVALTLLLVVAKPILKLGKVLPAATVFDTKPE